MAKVIDNFKVGKHLIIVLDGIQDPGNLGTIIRSARAFGIDSIVLSEDSVDEYNSKVIRASEGMMFSTNIVRTNLKDYGLSADVRGNSMFTSLIANTEAFLMMLPLLIAYLFVQKYQ